MFEFDIIRNEIENIYKKIPEFECKHCHKCCGPIVWFKAEEILIESYLKDHNIENVKLTNEEFQENDMRCPFLKNDRCSIYEVRPMVCRLQGNVPDLPCESNTSNFMPEDSIKKIQSEFYKLNKKFKGSYVFYSTRKMTKI